MVEVYGIFPFYIQNERGKYSLLWYKTKLFELEMKIWSKWILNVSDNLYSNNLILFEQILINLLIKIDAKYA